LEKGNHNQVKYDRTTWYTFTESFCKNHKSILQFCQMEVAKTTNGFGENNEPIPVSNHPEKQLNKQKKESLDLSFLDQEPEKYKQAFLEYVEHRKSLKKPMNQQQVETTHKRLLTVSINERIESIEASISAGWQGLFLPKSKKQEPAKTTQPVNPRPTHCDHCGKPMVTNKCSCGRQLFSNNGVYSFEDGPSVDVKKQFNEAMRILL